MKTILLPFHDDDIDQAALDTALLIANRFSSHIEGLFVWQPPQIIAGAGEGITLYGDYVTQIAAEGRQLASQAKESFSKIVAEKGITVGALDNAADEPTAGWYEDEGLEDRVVGDYGRIFDLIVVGRTGKPVSGDWNTTCEAALFESGRPVVVAPEKAPAELGRTMMIAWNCSTETARTVALGMPFLTQADRVIVLTVEGGTVPGPSGEQLTQHLARNGVSAQAKTVSAEGGKAGEAILAEAVAAGVDLLIKGAYTHSRLRQMIFGGATRHILSNATMPVFMAH